MCCGIAFKPPIRTKRRGLSSSGVCPQRDDARRLLAHHTVKYILGFKIAGLTPFHHIHQIWHPAIFPERRSHGTSLPVGWAGKGGGAWLVAQQTKHFCRGTCVLVEQEEVCRAWWVPHWGLLSLSCVYLSNNALYIIFFSFSIELPLYFVQRQLRICLCA